MTFGRQGVSLIPQVLEEVEPGAKKKNWPFQRFTYLNKESEGRLADNSEAPRCHVKQPNGKEHRKESSRDQFSLVRVSRIGRQRTKPTWANVRPSTSPIAITWKRWRSSDATARKESALWLRTA